MARRKTKNLIETPPEQRSLFHLRIPTWWGIQQALLENLSDSAIKEQLTRWLSWFSRIRSRATFICVTGSSAKTSTVGILSHILEGQGPVHTQMRKNAVKV